MGSSSNRYAPHLLQQEANNACSDAQFWVRKTFLNRLRSKGLPSSVKVSGDLHLEVVITLLNFNELQQILLPHFIIHFFSFVNLKNVRCGNKDPVGLVGGLVLGTFVYHSPWLLPMRTRSKINNLSGLVW